MTQDIELKPLRDKVLGKMIDPPGTTRTTRAGIILPESQFGEDTVRPRWFEVTHVGPEQQDVRVGDYVLVAHGRWTRGIDIENSRKEQDKLFFLDNDEILGVSDEPELP